MFRSLILLENYSCISISVKNVMLLNIFASCLDYLDLSEACTQMQESLIANLLFCGFAGGL